MKISHIYNKHIYILYPDIFAMECTPATPPHKTAPLQRSALHLELCETAPLRLLRFQHRCTKLRGLETHEEHLRNFPCHAMYGTLQRPLKEWVSTKDHYFSRDLPSTIPGDYYFNGLWLPGGIFTYIWLIFIGKCRQIYHTWMVWDCII